MLFLKFISPIEKDNTKNKRKKILFFNDPILNFEDMQLAPPRISKKIVKILKPRNCVRPRVRGKIRNLSIFKLNGLRVIRYLKFTVILIYVKPYRSI